MASSTYLNVARLFCCVSDHFYVSCVHMKVPLSVRAISKMLVDTFVRIIYHFLCSVLVDISDQEKNPQMVRNVVA